MDVFCVCNRNQDVYDSFFRNLRILRKNYGHDPNILSTALESISLFPLPIESEEDLLCLEGIDDALARNIMKLSRGTANEIICNHPAAETPKKSLRSSTKPSGVSLTAKLARSIGGVLNDRIHSEEDGQVDAFLPLRVRLQKRLHTSQSQTSVTDNLLAASQKNDEITDADLVSSLDGDDMYKQASVGMKVDQDTTLVIPRSPDSRLLLSRTLESNVPAYKPQVAHQSLQPRHHHQQQPEQQRKQRQQLARHQQQNAYDREADKAHPQNSNSMVVDLTSPSPAEPYYKKYKLSSVEYSHAHINHYIDDTYSQHDSPIAALTTRAMTDYWTNSARSVLVTTGATTCISDENYINLDNASNVRESHSDYLGVVAPKAREPATETAVPVCLPTVPPAMTAEDGDEDGGYDNVTNLKHSRLFSKSNTSTNNQCSYQDENRIMKTSTLLSRLDLIGTVVDDENDENECDELFMKKGYTEDEEVFGRRDDDDDDCCYVMRDEYQYHSNSLGYNPLVSCTSPTTTTTTAGSKHGYHVTAVTNATDSDVIQLVSSHNSHNSHNSSSNINHHVELLYDVEMKTNALMTNAAAVTNKQDDIVLGSSRSIDLLKLSKRLTSKARSSAAQLQTQTQMQTQSFEHNVETAYTNDMINRDEEMLTSSVESISTNNRNKMKSHVSTKGYTSKKRTTKRKEDDALLASANISDSTLSANLDEGVDAAGVYAGGVYAGNRSEHVADVGVDVDVDVVWEWDKRSSSRGSNTAPVTRTAPSTAAVAAATTTTMASNNEAFEDLNICTDYNDWEVTVLVDKREKDYQLLKN